MCFFVQLHVLADKMFVDSNLFTFGCETSHSAINESLNLFLELTSTEQHGLRFLLKLKTEAFEEFELTLSYCSLYAVVND